MATGESLLAPPVTKRLIEAFVKTPERSQRSAPGLDELTPREHEILQLVAAGLSNGEIAERLWLSPLTVKTHVSHVLSKLDARDRVQLVVAAYETGIVVAGADEGVRRPGRPTCGLDAAPPEGVRHD